MDIEMQTRIRAALDKTLHEYNFQLAISTEPHLKRALLLAECIESLSRSLNPKEKDDDPRPDGKSTRHPAPARE